MSSRSRRSGRHGARAGRRCAACGGCSGWGTRRAARLRCGAGSPGAVHECSFSRRAARRPPGARCDGAHSAATRGRRRGSCEQGAEAGAPPPHALRLLRRSPLRRSACRADAGLPVRQDCGPGGHEAGAHAQRGGLPHRRSPHHGRPRHRQERCGAHPTLAVRPDARMPACPRRGRAGAPRGPRLAAWGLRVALQCGARIAALSEP